jgi:signal peptidase I
MPSRKLRPGRAIVASALLLLLAKAFVLDGAIVDGRSMLPTLSPGSFVLILRCAYGLPSPWGPGYLLRWARPRRGDLVAALSPRDGLPVVKRVAAAGPATLSAAAGHLLGPGVDEPLTSEQAQRIGRSLELASGFVLLFGDNPGESLDSRDYGPVRIEDVSGRVLSWRGWARE